MGAHGVVGGREGDGGARGGGVFGGLEGAGLRGGLGRGVGGRAGDEHVGDLGDGARDARGDVGRE